MQTATHDRNINIQVVDLCLQSPWNTAFNIILASLKLILAIERDALNELFGANLMSATLLRQRYHNCLLCP